MIQFILIVFGLVLFIDQLFVKWAWYDKLSLWARYQAESKFLTELVECPFCCRTHISIIITVILGAILGYEVYMIAVPFVVSGLMTLKR